MTNLVVEQIGLADKAGVAHIVVDHARNLGGNRISSAGGQKVKLTTIDSYCDEHRIAKIDLVKIDTEGFEERIVRGGANTLKRHKPALYIEVNNQHLARYGDDVQSLFSVLRSLGYEHFTIANTGTVVTDERELIGKHVDVIAR